MQSSDRRRGYGTVGEVVQRDYFKITALEDCEVWLKGGVSSGYLLKKVYYSKNNGVTWNYNDLTQYTSFIRVILKKGRSVCFKAESTWSNNGFQPDYRRRFTSTGKVNISGNLLSLVWGDNFEGKKTMPPKSSGLAYQTFAYLFGRYDSGEELKVVSAQDLVLPLETINPNIFYNLFADNKTIEYAPRILPAKDLTPGEGSYAGCYGSMFRGCTALRTAPELPATTLANDCYKSMFQGCTSLTTAPELPARGLKRNCYMTMFSGCTSLNYIKAMFYYMATQNYTIADGIRDWVKGVAANGTFVKNSSASWNLTGDSGIPSGWTVQTASE